MSRSSVSRKVPFYTSLLSRNVLIQGFQRGYERKGVFPVHAILNHLGEENVDFGGDIISVISLRYQTFAQSLSCVRCGLTGTYFAKERSAKFDNKSGLWRVTTDGWHFNLYGLTEDGKEVMLTKDHIIPRSKGGPDEIGNMQTMCKPCNGNKKDMLPWQCGDAQALIAQIPEAVAETELLGLGKTIIDLPDSQTCDQSLDCQS